MVLGIRGKFGSVAVAVGVSLLAGCDALGIRALKSEAEYFTPSARIYFDTGDDEDDEVDLYRDGSLSAAVDFLAIQKPFLVRRSTLAAAKETQLENDKEELKTLQNAARTLRVKASEMEAEVEAEVAEAKAKDASLEMLRAGMQAREKLQLAKGLAELAQDKAEEKEQDVAKMEKVVNRANKSRLDGDWILGPRLSIGITGPAGDSEDGSEQASGAPVLFLAAGVYMDLFKGNREPNSTDGVGVRLEFGTIWGVTADESIGDTDDSAVFVGLSVFL